MGERMVVIPEVTEGGTDESIDTVTRAAFTVEALPAIQDTLMETEAPFTVPEPSATLQVCTGLIGWVSTVTAKLAPLLKPVASVTEPLAETSTISPLPVVRPRPEPARPDTEAVTEYDAGASWPHRHPPSTSKPSNAATTDLDPHPFGMILPLKRCLLARVVTG